MMNQSSQTIKSEEMIKIEVIKFDNDWNCEICYRKYQRQFFYSFGCQHYFCKNCLILAISQKTNDFMQLRCCQQGCQQLLDQSQKSIYHLLPNNTKKKVDLILDNLDRMHNIRTCKNCNKGALIETINAKNKQVLKCRECQQLSCYNCFSLVHQGKCTNAQILDYPSNCGQCRKCKSIIEKKIGCSHVKCICGYQFCFQCSYHWDPSHVCQFKLQKRTGWSKWICNFAKIILAVPLFIFMLSMYIVYILLICCLSSLFFGALGWLTLLQKRVKKQNQINHNHKINKKDEEQPSGSLNCLMLLFWVIAWPIAIILCSILGFFLPFWNLCYDEQIVFSPTILIDLWSAMRAWIDVYLIL